MRTEQGGDGTWEVDYPISTATGVGGGFAALFVIALIFGVVGRAVSRPGRRALG